MDITSTAVQVVLGGGLLLVSLLSANLLFLAAARLRTEQRPVPSSRLEEDALPIVLVQLPLFNEGSMGERLLDAVARLDWPRERLLVQVLDDSTDGSEELSRRAVDSHRRAGLQVEMLHRRKRFGYKAGALAEGLRRSAAPYVAILDADFVPQPDFLKRLVPVLAADRRLAFAQAAWAHSNRELSRLTRAQALLLDAHFHVEQEARWRLGLPVAFNGTCGVWRREAIDDAGGWQGDTLSEDLDLSIRAQLAGWRACYVHTATVPGELPESARAWRTQQSRWTKGYAQCAVKLLPRVWRSAWPLWHRAAVTMQLSQSLFFPLGLLCLLLSLPLIAMNAHFHPALVAIGLSATGLGLAGTVAFLGTGQRVTAGRRLRHSLPSILVAIVLTSGLLLSNTRSVLEGLVGRRSEFVRTPKSQALAPAHAGHRWHGLAELGAGLALLTFLVLNHAWTGALMIFVIGGLLSIGLMQLTDASRALGEARLPQ